MRTFRATLLGVGAALALLPLSACKKEVALPIPKPVPSKAVLDFQGPVAYISGGGITLSFTIVDRMGIPARDRQPLVTKHFEQCSQDIGIIDRREKIENIAGCINSSAGKQENFTLAS